FVSSRPAVLLMVEGKPVLAPIQGTKLEFVLNSNWDLFFDPTASRYYLLAENVWLTTDSLDGSWTLAGKVPADLAKLPTGQGWDYVKKAVPAQVTKNTKTRKVFFATSPAELIIFKGQPVYKKIDGTSLTYATNTDSWVFADSQINQYYYLVTGRWFRAPTLDGPWTYATNELPEDFKRIPPDHETAEILASVPGTPEAADAVLLAQIPTAAT